MSKTKVKIMEFQHNDDQDSFPTSLIFFVKFWFHYFFLLHRKSFMEDNSTGKLKAKDINMNSLQCHQYEQNS